MLRIFEQIILKIALTIILTAQYYENVNCKCTVHL